MYRMSKCSFKATLREKKMLLFVPNRDVTDTVFCKFFETVKCTMLQMQQCGRASCSSELMHVQ